MRLVMVTHSFPRTESDLAGGFLWRLSEALVDRGHRVLVIAPADRGEIGPPSLGSVLVRRVRYSSPGRETLGYQDMVNRLSATSPRAVLAFVDLVRALRRAVEDECRAGDVNLVHAHWWAPGGMAAGLADRRGRPLVITLHGADVSMARAIPGARRVMGAVLRRASAVTAVSSCLAEEGASASGNPRDRITVTPMPLAGLPPDSSAVRQGVVFVGRLTRQKGVHDLLDALAILKRQGLAPELTVVGDGPERPALKAQALALGLSVVFAGFVAPELIASHVAGKRLFVRPSAKVGRGLAAAEALALGVPMVASASSDLPDLLLDPDAGVVVPPGDTAALAQAMRTVLVEERFVLGARRAARALLERRSPDRVAESFEAVYGGARGRGSRSSVAGARQ